MSNDYDRFFDRLAKRDAKQKDFVPDKAVVRRVMSVASDVSDDYIVVDCNNAYRVFRYPWDEVFPTIIYLANMEYLRIELTSLSITIYGPTGKWKDHAHEFDDSYH